MQSAGIKAIDPGCTDLDLVQGICARTPQAFELLMRRYNQTLYRTARSIVRDDTEAEDVVQDAYILAYRNMDKFRGDARLSTWLTRIVINEAIARSRKNHRRAKVIRLDGETELHSDVTEVNMNDCAPESPEQAAMRTQARAMLEAKIDQLPDAFRTVFVLRALEELSVEETAACLDIPEATVRTRFFRARSLLREALSREIDGAFEEAFTFDGARCDRIVAGVLARLKSVD